MDAVYVIGNPLLNVLGELRRCHDLLLIRQRLGRRLGMPNLRSDSGSRRLLNRMAVIVRPGSIGASPKPLGGACWRALISQADHAGPGLPPELSGSPLVG